MSKDNIEDIYPLSPLQEGLLFESLLRPESGMYLQQLSLRFKRLADPSAWKQAWQHIMERHSALRSSFVWQREGRPIQVVRKELKVPCKEVDWRAIEKSRQMEKLEEFLIDDRKQGFDLTKAPVLRLTLIRMSEEGYQSILSHHHLLVDGWSTSIILKEVFAIYGALMRGEEVKLEPVRPYRDYIEWLSRQDKEKAERYWRRMLRGFKAATPLPGEQGRREEEEEREEGTEQLWIGEELTDRLMRVARREEVTLNTIVEGVWAIMMSRHSGEREVVFGITVSGRTAEMGGVEGMVGLFINTLPLRIEVEGGEKVGRWLRAIQERAAEIREYEYSGLSEVQGWGEVGRGEKLFDSLVVFENYPEEVDLVEASGAYGVSRVDSMEKGDIGLSLVAVASGKRMLLELRYDAARYEKRGIRRMLRQMEEVIKGIAGGEDKQVRAIRMMPEEEMREVLEEWNETGSEEGEGRCVHEVIEEVAKKRGEKTAIEYEGVKRSYEEMNRRANKIGNYLRGRGVGPEKRVGIMMERSVEMVEGIIGVLKAGGAYVPLDPEYPKDRLEFMLDDSQASFVLTQQRLIERIGEQKAEIIKLDTDWEKIEAESDRDPVSGVMPDNPAYVMYTSGSTGRSKGVVVPHRGVCNTLSVEVEMLRIQTDDKVLQSASLSFDLSMYEMGMSLFGGATLCLAPQDSLLPGPALSKLLNDQAITSLTLPPSVLAHLPLEAFPKLRLITVAGEAAPADLVARWAKGRQVFNAYGPTETSMWVAGAFIDGSRRPPIGRPIANTKIYLLDEGLQPVPVGVPGELCVAGICLARGYLNLPDVTAEKFIPNPFSHEPGARLYRTGDLVRHQPDGTLEYLGRIDHQVKIHGYRIELGEIEAALNRHQKIRVAVATVQEDAQGGKRLVGYVVADEGQKLMISELRSYLNQRLPAYMVPSVFVFMDKLPLTPNMKVDRKALPMPPQIRPELKEEIILPRTPIEKALAEIWSEVLRVQQVGICDNFFELGGDSILSIQIAARANKMGIKLTTMQIFQHPTISELASVVTTTQGLQVEQHATADAARPAPFLAKPDQESLDWIAARYKDVEDIYPLSPMQQGMLFHTLYEPDSEVYFEQFSYLLNGSLDVAAFRRAWQTVAERHAVLRTAFVWAGLETPLQIVMRRIDLPFQQDDWRALSASEQQQRTEILLKQDRQRGFDLSKEPLMRFTLIRLADDSHKFIFSFHHMLMDGWSLSLLLNEVFLCYKAFDRGEELPRRRNRPYADYIKWLQQQDLSKAEAFWRETLSGFTSPTPLSVDRLNGERGSPEQEYGLETLQLSKQATGELQSLARQYRLTPNILAEGAWTLLLSRYSGQPDVMFGLTVSGRPPALEGCEKMIGLFINTLPVRVKASSDDTVVDLLTRLKGQQLKAMQYDYSSLAQVQAWSEMARGLPMFETLLIYENYPSDLSYEKHSPGELSVRETQTFGETNYPITVAAGGGERLVLQISYRKGRFEEAAIKRMLLHLRELLIGMAAGPNHHLSSLSLLTESEKNQLLMEWNSTSVDYQETQFVHRIFERQAQKEPRATAVIYKDKKLTYEELNRRANQLAHYLRKKGVGPETPVGILVERSIEMVIGLLGIMKAGGEYVPIATTSPAERIAYMLEDTKALLLLTQQSLLNVAPPLQTEVICLDKDWRQIDRETEDDPDIQMSAGNAVYIVYTSGSTGVPKGTVIQHGGLANECLAFMTDHELGPGERLLQFASPGFDVAAEEVFAPLISGATILLAPNEAALSIGELLDICDDANISVLNLPSSYWHEWVNELARGEVRLPASVRLVIIGNEKALLERYELWQHGVGDRIQLKNAYGPTEATITATNYINKRPLDRRETKSIPIGKPLRNVQVYVLDPRLAPVPIGVTGELYIGGAGIARGYLNRPELTAEKFIPNPFGNEAGARLFKTGDLVKYLADGNIEFMGRDDDQVKIRGYRIELGEVEALLRQHPDVQDAVAILWEAGEEKKLVAYVVVNPGIDLNAGELRRYLKEKMPAYMLPSQTIFIDRLPLTSNGKIDRRALPSPESDRLQPQHHYVAPRDNIESEVVRLWEELLPARPIGINDNFFELGGHSLLALRMIGLIEKHFKQRLPLNIVFEAGTIRQLSRALREQIIGDPRSSLVAIRAGGSKRPVYFVHVGSGNVLCYVDLARHLGEEQPFYGLQDTREPGGEGYVEIEEMAREYIEEIKQVQGEGPYQIGGWSFGGLVAYEMARQLSEQGEEVSLLALLDTGRPDQERDREEAEDEAHLLGVMAREMGLEISDEELREKGEEATGYVAQKMKEAGIEMAEAEEYLRRHVERYKGRVRAGANYRVRGYRGRIELYVAAEEEGGEQTRKEMVRGWEELAEGGVEVKEVSGKHHEIGREPNVREVAAKMKRSLERIEEMIEERSREKSEQEMMIVAS